jgi:hypothetical protein
MDAVDEFVATATMERTTRKPEYIAWPQAKSTGPISMRRNDHPFTAMMSPAAENKVEKQHVPGYTGFIANQQHVHARTFGETSRRCFANLHRDLCSTSPVPSCPQANRKIIQKDLPNSFMASIGQDGQCLVPGYTGHVPKASSAIGTSYGRATRECVEESRRNAGRPLRAQEAPNQAYTSFARQMRECTNMPLPAAYQPGRGQKPPELLVPVSTSNTVGYY